MSQHPNARLTPRGPGSCSAAGSPGGMRVSEEARQAGVSRQFFNMLAGRWHGSGGYLVTLLGPSGCGKSTLLRCLSGLEQVTEGTIILDGEDITNVPASKRNIGMVFQQYSLFPNMTVEQNIAFGLKMQKTPQDVIDKKVAEAIAMVELTGKERAHPASLSGGQQQRAALAPLDRDRA